MKRTALCLLSFISASSAYSVPLSTGLYLGLMATGSYPQKLNNIPLYWPNSVFSNTPASTAISVQNSRVSYAFGGGGGGQVGYRFRCFRLEGEFLYSSNRLMHLEANNTRVGKNAFAQQTYAQGHLNTAIGFFNFLYDLRDNTYGSEGVLSPYIGIGVGSSQTHHVSRFYDATKTYITDTSSTLTSKGYVGQGIIGLTYEMDSEASMYLDYRYVSLAKFKGADNIAVSGRPSLSTINLGINLIFWDSTYS